MEELEARHRGQVLITPAFRMRRPKETDNNLKDSSDVLSVSQCSAIFLINNINMRVEEDKLNPHGNNENKITRMV